MIIAYLATILLSIFSTAVLGYISIATPIGPWIAPTLALICLFVSHVLPARVAPDRTTIALCVAGGSVGGILATGVGFYFPTFYFVDPVAFNALMASPLMFWAYLSGISLVSALFGLLVANIFEEQLLDKDQLPFAIGQMVHAMIFAGDQVKKAWQLCIGFVSTLLFCMAQVSIKGFGPFIPREYMLLRAQGLSLFAVPKLVLHFDQLPMLIAIGFIAGHIIAIPLLVGLLTLLLIAEPINRLFFADIFCHDFTMAFCSGIVVFGALSSIYSVYARSRKQKAVQQTSTWASYVQHWQKMHTTFIQHILECVVILALLILMLTYTYFSWAAQIFVIIATFISSYQIIVIAGKIGLATMGRFATFVMVPAVLFFGSDGIQATIISTLVGIAGGVGTDILFGRKLTQMSGIPASKTRKFQLLGIITSSIAVGIIVWLLVHQFGLGSPELFAQRAQARALLLDCTHFNYGVLAMGMLFGLLLHQFKINELLVLGGLLMPIDYSLALIIGGFISYYLIDQKEGEPFWSGVFAANSIWMLIQALL
ncbi:MAG: OPT/YSL family transporter [Candidatus Babeliales bacterium]